MRSLLPITLAALQQQQQVSEMRFVASGQGDRMSL
jgi:hypothetical protein